MTDAPSIDAAIRAGCVTVGNVGCLHSACSYRSMQCLPSKIVLAALRASNPWEPAHERLAAMAKAFVGEHRWFTFNAGEEKREIAAMLLAVRADPIMRELYDSDGKPR